MAIDSLHDTVVRSTRVMLQDLMEGCQGEFSRALEGFFSWLGVFRLVRMQDEMQVHYILRSLTLVRSSERCDDFCRCVVHCNDDLIDIVPFSMDGGLPYLLIDMLLDFGLIGKDMVSLSQKGFCDISTECSDIARVRYLLTRVIRKLYIPVLSFLFYRHYKERASFQVVGQGVEQQLEVYILGERAVSVPMYSRTTVGDMVMKTRIRVVFEIIVGVVRDWDVSQSVLVRRDKAVPFFYFYLLIALFGVSPARDVPKLTSMEIVAGGPLVALVSKQAEFYFNLTRGSIANREVVDPVSHIVTRVADQLLVVVNNNSRIIRFRESSRVRNMVICVQENTTEIVRQVDSRLVSIEMGLGNVVEHAECAESVLERSLFMAGSDPDRRKVLGDLYRKKKPTGGFEPGKRYALIIEALAFLDVWFTVRPDLDKDRKRKERAGRYMGSDLVNIRHRLSLLVQTLAQVAVTDGSIRRDLCVASHVLALYSGLSS